MDKLSRILEILKRKQKSLRDMLDYYDNKGETRSSDMVSSQLIEVDGIIRCIENEEYLHALEEIWLQD